MIFKLLFMSSLLLSGVTLAQSQTAVADDLRYKKLLDRVELLEAQQQELLLSNAEGERNHVYSFLKDNLTIGGFFETGMTFIDGPDTTFQSVNDENALGLNISAEFNPKWRFVSQLLTALSYPQQNQHNDPRAVSFGSPKTRAFGDPALITILTQGYIEYAFNDHLHIQGGEGYVPFGFAHQQREFVLFVRRGGPQILRTDNSIINPLWSGVHLNGSFAAGVNEWGFNLYSMNPLPGEKPKVLGVGGRAWLSSYDDALVGGVSSQVRKSGTETDEIYGADLRFNKRPYLVTGEYAIRNHNGGNSWTAYLEPSLYVYEDEFLLFVFGDFLRNLQNTTGRGATAIFDPLNRWEYGGGVNWLPTSFTRIRLALTMGDYVGNGSTILGQNKDFMSVDLSAGIAF